MGIGMNVCHVGGYAWMRGAAFICILLIYFKVFLRFAIFKVTGRFRIKIKKKSISAACISFARILSTIQGTEDQSLQCISRNL